VSVQWPFYVGSSSASVDEELIELVFVLAGRFACRDGRSP